MSYEVKVLGRARNDLDEILAYIQMHSPEGAARLLQRFDQALESLSKHPFVQPVAPENQVLNEGVRHILFRTRAGRTYRAVFVVVADEVRVLRVRGGAQQPLTADDLDIRD
jgi:plasmid stabilization system protein ParE